MYTTTIPTHRFLRQDDHKGNKKIVLVIGGAGYIGSALIPKLLAKGYRVRLLDMLLFGTEPLRDVIEDDSLEILQGDFRNVGTVVEAMRGVDSVIHLGAVVGDPACALDEQFTIEVNLQATKMIADVAKGTGVSRFIFASTCSVYGANDNILNEQSDPNPVSLYALTKIAAEQVLEKMADDTFAPTCLRFGTIYGLSGRTRFDLVINLLTAKACLEGRITVFGGSQWRPFLHVDDAALAVTTALDAPHEKVANQVFNVGSNAQNYTIQQAAETIQALVPSAELIQMGDDIDLRNYRVDFSKISETLGFAPQWTVEEGSRQVIRAIETGQVHDYSDAMYSNAKFLEMNGRTSFVAYENSWVNELLTNVGASWNFVAPREPALLFA